jgi:hypothetical protein
MRWKARRRLLRSNVSYSQLLVATALLSMMQDGSVTAPAIFRRVHTQHHKKVCYSRSSRTTALVYISSNTLRPTIYSFGLNRVGLQYHYNERGEI